MVSLQIVQQSNSRLASLPKGLVALFIGATSGIGQSTLQHLAQNAASPRIYTVARPQSADAHETFLSGLRQANPTASLTLIKADTSLVTEVDKAVAAVKQNETKLDILFLSAGFMPFEGRQNTSEGLDASTSTRYYSRLRAVEQLLPLLNAAPSPRIVSVLAAGMEAPLNEEDMDLRAPGSWSVWGASQAAATMGTLSLEKLARENPRLSAVHWFPGPVETPGLARGRKYGMGGEGAMSQDESGARGLFLATSDRYAAPEGGSLISVPEGLGIAARSGGGIFLVNPVGESVDNEKVLAGMRERKLDDKVWSFTQDIFASCVEK